MKKILALSLAICMLASVLCVPAFAADTNSGGMMSICGQKNDGSLVVIKGGSNYEEIWEAAIDYAEDSGYMKDRGYDRIVVTLHGDWKANAKGEFGSSWGDGFQQSTIYIPQNVRITLDLNGYTIDRNLREDEYDGEVIYIDKNADVIIKNGKITGGWSCNGAGGIHVKSGAKVTLDNVDLTGNRAHNGGAIYIDNGTVDVVKSAFSFNESGRNGGAIYVYNGNLSVDKDTVFSYNVSKKDGGAIYVHSQADKVTIEGYYIGNSASDKGGAVVVNCSISGENGVKIGNVEMSGNVASAYRGGAVYVDSDNDLSLYGKVIMHGNSPDNLHIRSEAAIKENNMTEGSMVGIFTNWEVTESAPYKIKNPQYFFSDKTGYDIKVGNETLYYVKSAEGAPSSYKVGDVEYPLIKNLFSYTAIQGDTMTPYFFYSDGYFAEDPRSYNEHLASFAASMALAAMPAVYEGEYTEDKVAKNLTSMFAAMGYSDIFVHYPEPEYFGPDAENLSTIGYAIAKKTVVIDGQEQTIIATAVRGSGYGAEWASNVTLGSGTGEAKGFGDAAKQVKQGIDAYVAQHGIAADSAKFFITGYSRAGATSNLVAKKLTDTYGEDQVYAYCFEAPKGGVASEMKAGFTYTNIHNIINGVDIVATVGPAQMGFIRYGVDHMIPKGEVGSTQYNEQKTLMLAQLAAINEQVQHNDYFHEATIEYIRSTIAGWDMISQIAPTDKQCPNDWVPYFIEKLQEYSFSDMDNESNGDSIFNRESENFVGYRSFWADYEWYLYFDENDGNKVKIKAYATAPEDANTVDYVVLSVEDAIATIMQFYFGSSDEVKEEIMGAIDLNAIMDNIDMIQIYMVVIDEWNDLTIEEKNEEFHKLWGALGLEESLKGILTDEEIKTLTSSLYVVLDFLLDFVAEDYDETNQNIVGTLVYNIGNILQTHYHDVTYSWVRSYDSYYSDIKYVCKHSYGEWNIVKEASTEDYGVQVKTCTLCNEDIYEAIPKTVIEPPEDDNPAGTASLIGEGSVLVVAICISLMVGFVAGVFLQKKFEKGTDASSKETNDEK